jgi:hypothetical protein
MDWFRRDALHLAWLLQVCRWCPVAQGELMAKHIARRFDLKAEP